MMIRPKYTIYASCLTAITVFICGCSLLDNETVIPAFIVIDDVEFNTLQGQGENTHNITDIWVTSGVDNLGVYAIPTSIPIIPTGPDQPIRITAGIKPNGVNGQSLNYPFFKPINLVETLNPEQQLVLSPDFEYVDEVKFDFIDDFEGGTVFNNDIDENIETSIVRSSAKVRSGNSSGLVQLDASNNEFVATTMALFSAEDNAGGATFLEFDYLSDVSVAIGYRTVVNGAINVDFPYIFVPQEEWTHIYADLTPYVTAPAIDQYQVILSAIHEGTGVDSIFFDNVKLLHF